MLIYSAKDLSALIRTERKKKGWTQEDLANRAEVSIPWLSQLERGKATVQLGLVLRILKELQLSLRIGNDHDRGAPQTDPDFIDLNRIVASKDHGP
jgi:HTH-type transcriptional regulator/antitoxin HipB